MSCQSVKVKSKSWITYSCWGKVRHLIAQARHKPQQGIVSPFNAWKATATMQSCRVINNHFVLVLLSVLNSVKIQYNGWHLNTLFLEIRGIVVDWMVWKWQQWFQGYNLTECNNRTSVPESEKGYLACPYSQLKPSALWLVVSDAQLIMFS